MALWSQERSVTAETQRWVKHPRMNEKYTDIYTEGLTFMIIQGQRDELQQNKQSNKNG